MNPTKRGNRRLLKLAKRLVRVPEHRFDYSKWVGPDWEGRADLSCGTTGCAIGWGSTMPEFRKLGLKITPYLGWDEMLRKDVIKGGDLNDTGTEAALDIFSLTEVEFHYLFLPGETERFADAKYVAKKIRKFVEERGGYTPSKKKTSQKKK